MSSKTPKAHYNHDDCPEVEISWTSETVEAKVREIKPMPWWWMYKVFPYCHHHRKWYFRFFVNIEKFVRFVIRKPVRCAKPKFEVEQDIRCLHGVDAEKELSDMMVNEINATRND